MTNVATYGDLFVTIFAIWFTIAVVSGLMGYFVAVEFKKWLGLALGLLFGPFGVLIAALVQKD